MTGPLVLRVVDGPDLATTVPVLGAVVVGREGHLVLTDPTASRRHAQIEPRGDHLCVTDLGSASGTRVDGARVDHPVDVPLGEVVTIGASSVMGLQVARFHPPSTGPGLLVRTPEGARRVTITGRVTIGRDPLCDVVVPAAEVSRLHAVVRHDGAHIDIEDQGSSNGTRVNGRPITGRAVLQAGDRVELGRSTARLTVSDGDRLERSVTVRAQVEGAPDVMPLTLETTGTASVAEVTAALVAVAGADRSASWLLYRPADGVILHPDDEWAATGNRRGEEVVLGEGDATELPWDGVRRWPRTTDGRVNQLPRTEWPATAHVLSRPTPPETTSFRGRGTLWQIIGGVGAIVVGLSMAVLGGKQYALFGIMAGLIGVVTVGASIAGDQSRRRHGLGEYRRRLEALDEELVAERRRQARAASTQAPTIEELSRWVETGSGRLWERRPSDPDALRLRIGTGRRALLVETERSRDPESPYSGEYDEVVARHRWLDGVPVCGPGIEVGTVGVAGDSSRVRELVSRMVVEAACVHAPHQLQLWVASASPNWEWCRWLPDGGAGGAGVQISRDAAGAQALLADLRTHLDPSSQRDPGQLDLVIVDVGRTGPAVEAVMRDIPGRGVVLVVADDPRDLPNGLGVVLEIAADGTGTVIGSYPDAPVGSFAADALDPVAAERLAILLGALGPETASATGGALLELLGLGSVEELDVAAAWAEHRPDTLSVSIGVDDAGDPLSIGFRRDGPHAMVAGTTGSGKSELLQTLLVALAVTHSPADLALFLIDFKGGATFAPLVDLPHVTGLVTDLESDGSLATRAFTALDAEIERRKRVLDAARVANIIDYGRLAPDGREPLPNLLVVIDEFALLVERQPEVKDRLDTVATQGRSLGIHLLLATQSPSGVITHAIRTNTNLWICLRVVTDAESMELLGSKDASRLPDNSPGRGFVRLGAGDDRRGFQAARIARPLPGAASPVTVRDMAGSRLYEAPVEDDEEERGPTTEMEVVVDRIVAAARESGLPPSRPLWLPPLPPVLVRDDLPDLDRPTDRLVALVGLVDRPEVQAVEPFTFDLTASGHALVSGLLGFGKTTALIQVGADLARHRPPSALHLYGIEAGGGGLSVLAELPHAAAVVPVGDAERLTRMLGRLVTTIERRRADLADAGAGSFVRWRASGGTEPWIVLLMDDYPSFREAADQIELGRPLDLFNSILQNGPSVGVHVVVAVSQAGDLRLSQTSLIPTRLLFRQSEAGEYSLLELRLRPSEVPMGPPGRALAAGGASVQVLLPGPDEVAEIAARWRDESVSGHPRPIARMPALVARHELPPPPASHVLALGLGGPELELVSVGLAAGGALLVVGPLQSGRSSTLVGVFDAVVDADRLARCTVVATRPSPLRQLDPGHPNIAHVVTDVNRLPDVLEELTRAADPHSVLIIDDAEGLSGSYGVVERLDALVRSAGETGLRTVVAARVNDLPGLYDPWMRYLVSLRRAVLLQPTADDAFVFGTKLPVIPSPGTPGRGVLVDTHRVVVVQVAQPDGLLIGGPAS